MLIVSIEKTMNYLISTITYSLLKNKDISSLFIVNDIIVYYDQDTDLE